MDINLGDPKQYATKEVEAPKGTLFLQTKKHITFSPLWGNHWSLENRTFIRLVDRIINSRRPADYKESSRPCMTVVVSRRSNGQNQTTTRQSVHTLLEFPQVFLQILFKDCKNLPLDTVCLNFKFPILSIFVYICLYLRKLKKNICENTKLICIRKLSPTSNLQADAEFVESLKLLGQSHSFQTSNIPI